MKLILLILLPFTVFSGNLEELKVEAFKKVQKNKDELETCRPDSYFKLLEKLKGQSLVLENEEDKILVEIIENRNKNLQVFKDFEQFYQIHNIKYVVYGSTKNPGTDIVLHYLIEIKPEFRDPSLNVLIIKYKDIYDSLKVIDRNKIHKTSLSPNALVLDEKWINKYKMKHGKSENVVNDKDVIVISAPIDDEEKIPTNVLREITDVIHATQLTIFDENIYGNISEIQILNIQNRILLDKKYHFPLYEAAIFCTDRSMKFNFIQLLMYQKEIDPRVFKLLAQQAFNWKDEHLVKLILKALHKHPSKENLETVLYIFNSSSRPDYFAPDFVFSSPYENDDDLKAESEKKWQEVFSKYKETASPEDLQVMEKVGFIKE